MKRSAGTVERACELVGAALVWGHSVHVTVQRPKGTGRPTYSVDVIGAQENDTQGPAA